MLCLAPGCTTPERGGRTGVCRPERRPGGLINTNEAFIYGHGRFGQLGLSFDVVFTLPPSVPAKRRDTRHQISKAHLPKKKKEKKKVNKMKAHQNVRVSAGLLKNVIFEECGVVHSEICSGVNGGSASVVYH